MTVPEFLSEAWVAGLVGSGGAPGPTGTVQVVVTGAPEGDGKFHVRVDDGVVAEAAPGSRPAPDVTFTASYPDASAIAGGEFDPSVAFMQGRLKTAGDPGLVLDLLAGAAART
jgi:putative sterol carrier protein